MPVLEILSDSKFKLINKYLLECVETILLIKNEHCFFIVNRVHRPETQRTITIGYQYGIAGDTCRAFVFYSICKCKKKRVNLRQIL